MSPPFGQLQIINLSLFVVESLIVVRMQTVSTTKLGGGLSCEEVFALLTQLPQVRISSLTKIF